MSSTSRCSRWWWARGLRLFDGIDTSGLRLQLTGTKTFANGIVQLTYAPGTTHPTRTGL
jgi:hypothetical protein